MPVLVIGCSLLAAALLLAAHLGTRRSPQRMLRAFRDPRLLARLDALVRELTRRGWTATPPRADDPPTLRRLTRDGALTLTVGCAPWSDWCSLELTRACGLAPDDLVAPPPFDRDGVPQAPTDVHQPGGRGFVVRPLAAHARVSAPLRALLHAWPPAWDLRITGDQVSMRAQVRGIAEIEAVVEDVLARFADVGAQ
ncbi:hypothetical protein OV090_37225 [Nannocystis sp. RBIL2]|uniref:hypothetical protein n=1 Tax=Nannocystis sp. RBIL2 TaxID=2996788 RepID=UPI00226F206B|nr:hypothetical protein [Nannocystis sp. RBIL2]MCY1070443.1 hypothetical protein [Nannocystis sp. RBIL2]